MRLIYKEIEKRYTADSLRAYLNKICIAEIYYASDNSKGESKPWRAEMRLPGFKHAVVKVGCAKDGKDRVEKSLKAWLEWTGLDEISKE